MFSSKCAMAAKGIMHSAKSQKEKKVLRDKQIKNLSLNDFLGEQKSKKTLEQRIKCLNELRNEYKGRCDPEPLGYRGAVTEEEQVKFKNSCPGDNPRDNPGNYLSEIDRHIGEIEAYIKNNNNKTVVRSSSEPDKVTPMVNIDRRINSAPGDLEGVRTKEEYVNGEKYVETKNEDGKTIRFALGGKKHKTKKHKKKGKKKTMRKKGKKKTNKRKGKKKIKKRGKKKTKKRGKKSRK